MCAPGYGGRHESRSGESEPDAHFEGRASVQDSVEEIESWGRRNDGRLYCKVVLGECCHPHPNCLLFCVITVVIIDIHYQWKHYFIFTSLSLVSCLRDELFKYRWYEHNKKTNGLNIVEINIIISKRQIAINSEKF